eukprot:TRINITY_DN9665_c0_g3_i1.p1 TRINITY_DN9665_c0_g3~~TRINITY_DN9665_c0_g3_i1.p1  ORF type:complete len:547 (+),score=91.51 TRINITY_DN9665_c0_g3_i1:39-1643(+)
MAKSRAFATNFYDVLQLGTSATFSDIRTAYRRAALATHPDKGGSADRFLLVTQAFETLACDKSRAAYDRKLQNRGDLVHASGVASSATEFQASASSSCSDKSAFGNAEARDADPAKPSKSSCGKSEPAKGSPRKEKRKVRSSDDPEKKARGSAKQLERAFQKLQSALQEVSPPRRKAALQSLQQHARLRFLQFMESARNGPHEKDDVSSWALIPFVDSCSSDTSELDCSSDSSETSDATEEQRTIAKSDSALSQCEWREQDHLTEDHGGAKRRRRHAKGVFCVGSRTYFAQLMFARLLCYTKCQQTVELAVEHYILLVQVRNAAVQEASSRGVDLCEMTDSSLIREAFDRVLAQTSISSVELGLHVAVWINFGRRSRSLKIMTPMFSLEDALSWRNRLMVAKATGWDALSSVWMDVLQHPAFKKKKPLSVDEATHFVNARRSMVEPLLLRRRFLQARTRSSIEQRLESRLCRAVRAVERALVNEAHAIRMAAAEVSRAKRKLEQERSRWFRRLPGRDMTLEDLMTKLPPHLQRG